MASLSVVVPVFNEAQNVAVLHRELKAALDSLKRSYEAVFVDDGSTDGTFKALEAIHKSDQRVKVVKLQRNFGQTTALSAGFANASGDIIITMDGDLQNDPKDIPALLNKVDEGFDVVSGWRHKRKDPFFTKVVPSLISNSLAKMLTGVNIHDYGCSLKAYTKRALHGVKLYGEMHRYIPAIVAMNGFSVGEVKVNHRSRSFGKSKYNFTRLVKGMLDLLYIKFWSTYGTRPLHLFGLLGIFQYFLAVIIFVEQVIKAFIIKALNIGPLLLLAVLLVIMGTLFILFGFLGEIMIRTYYASAGEPYVVEKVLKH